MPPARRSYEEKALESQIEAFFDDRILDLDSLLAANYRAKCCHLASGKICFMNICHTGRGLVKEESNRHKLLGCDFPKKVFIEVVSMLMRPPVPRDTVFRTLRQMGSGL